MFRIWYDGGVDDGSFSIVTACVSIRKNVFREEPGSLIRQGCMFIAG